MFFCGIIGNVGAAAISDAWTAHTERGKSYVACIMCLLGAVTMFLMFSSNNFYFALAMYALWFLLSDGFVAPVLNMMSLAAPANAKGQIFGYFITIVSIDGVVTPLIMTALLGPQPTHQWLALMCLLNTAIPCILAAVCFWMAGIDFELTMRRHKEEKVLGMAKSMSVLPEMQSIHLTHGVDAELVEQAMKMLGSGVVDHSLKAATITSSVKIEQIGSVALAESSFNFGGANALT